MNNILFLLLAMQDPTIDYSFQRLSKLIPKHADDPDRLSKVCRERKKIEYLLFDNHCRKSFSNERLIYSNNVTLCLAILIISLFQHHQVIMKMTQVKFSQHVFFL